MELLKQLEAKLQTLLQQRNQLREEVERLKGVDEELHGVRRRLEDLQAEKAALVKERDEIREQVDLILKMAEDMA